MNGKVIVEINSMTKGSTGKIMFGIADAARQAGYTVYTATAVNGNEERINDRYHIYIGTKVEKKIHLILAKFLGKNGEFSHVGTWLFLRKLNKIKPDIIHIHNLHNCYINLKMLFDYIEKNDISVIWTLHDCWAFTGHCPYFDMVGCDKWKTGCYDCAQYQKYPYSRIDSTQKMYLKKKSWFCIPQIKYIVTPSMWLEGMVKESFLKNYPTRTIYNGIDLNIFKPTVNDFKKEYGIEDKYMVLSVAYPFNERKGYSDFIALGEILEDDYRLVVVGVDEDQIAHLPKNIIGIKKTNSPKELANIYSAADVFVNTTYEDNYPTVNLEARACGTPVITYNSGGSPESAGEDGTVIEKGNILALKSAIESVVSSDISLHISDSELSQSSKFMEYVELYSGGVLELRKEYGCLGKIVLLGVAAVWEDRKGIDVFKYLANKLDTRYQIILVGTNDVVDKALPKNIISIHRTENQLELAALYAMADFFINPTREEVLGMVNIEANACGTPVITFRSGGSPETIASDGGMSVEPDSMRELMDAIERFSDCSEYNMARYVNQAHKFDSNTKFGEYVEIYNEIERKT